MSETAAETLIREAIRNQNQLTAYAYSILQDWSLAQDAVQEMLITISTRPGKYRYEGNLRGWLQTIVHRKAIDILRKRRREQSFADDELRELASRCYQNYTDDQRREGYEERKQVAYTCMNELDETSLTTLLSFYRDRMSATEIGDATGRSANAVCLSLSRIRKHLRRCIAVRLEDAQA